MNHSSSICQGKLNNYSNNLKFAFDEKYKKGLKRAKSMLKYVNNPSQTVGDSNIADKVIIEIKEKLKILDKIK